MAGAAVRCCVRADDGMHDVGGQGAPRDHDRRAHRRHLHSAGAAKHLRRALGAAMRQRPGRVLLEPHRELAETANMGKRRRYRKERRDGGALELAPAHFAA